ncbi:MAG: HAMP domain-containing sensor histidine kinase [Thermodesulfobacteriota bacterium]|nr:HAMP domain-containing sensor histidine kinase [Thermodesulfobacteriota bacterium]
MIMGLRAQIVLTTTLLVCAGLLLSSVFLLEVLEETLRQERVDRVITLLRVVSWQGGRQPTSVPVDHVLQRFSGELDLLEHSVFDSSLQKRSGRLPPGENAADLRRVLESGTMMTRIETPRGLRALMPGATGGFFDVILPLHGDQNGGSVLSARFSLDGVAQRVALARNTALLLIAGFSVVLVAFGVYLIDRSVIGPTRRLMEATSAIAEGRLSHELDVHGPREIAQLTSSFNTMTEALAHSRRQTEQTIASLHRANRELSETQGRLARSQKMAAVGHLAAGMAHEIGNPLGAAMGYLGMLKGESNGKEFPDLVQYAQNELERIDKLVRDLLDFARPGDAAQDVFDPGDAAHEAMTLLTHQGLFKGAMRLADEIPQKLSPVRAQRHKLVQVFTNLLLNARDACGNAGTVAVRGRFEASWIVFEVEDDGPGMNQEVAAQIFDPFFTTKEPGRGRGLGLFFCHKAVEQMGGRLDVVSETGRGSRFVLRLPVHEEGTA